MLTAKFAGRTVEVVNTLTLGGRNFARVRIIKGKPFTSWTHGGWADEDEKLVEADRLEQVKSTNPILQLYIEMCRAKREYDKRPDDPEARLAWVIASERYQYAVDLDDAEYADWSQTREAVRP